MKKSPSKPSVVAETDLCKITRHSSLALTIVTLHLSWNSKVRWLLCGQSELQYSSGTNTWALKSYLDGATDFEHDSAYAFRLPLIGLTFDSLLWHTSTFKAWVDPNNLEDFHVPRPGYNPLTMKDTHQCTLDECQPIPERHVIVPEGFYVPPVDEELFEAVKGKQVVIEVGINYPQSADES